MAYVTVGVDVDVDLVDFDDQELIDELEERGWYVSEDEPNEQLTREEKDVIMNMMGIGKVGSIEYNIYEKLRKR
jgi:hypothetical protein